MDDNAENLDYVARTREVNHRLRAENERLRKIVEELAQGNRMSETEGTLLNKFERLRKQARAVLGEKP